MGMIYDLEKVLYLANREEGLHVRQKEPRGSDLLKHLDHCISKSYVQRIPDKSTKDRFYGITHKGKVQLLKLKIKWRTAHDKPVRKEEQELEELEKVGV